MSLFAIAFYIVARAETVILEGYVTKDAVIISVLRGLKKYCRSCFVQALFLFKSKKKNLIWLHSVICISIFEEGMTISFSFKCDKQTNYCDVQGALKIFRIV